MSFPNCPLVRGSLIPYILLNIYWIQAETFRYPQERPLWINYLKIYIASNANVYFPTLFKLTIFTHRSWQQMMNSFNMIHHKLSSNCFCDKEKLCCTNKHTNEAEYCVPPRKYLLRYCQLYSKLIFSKCSFCTCTCTNNSLAIFITLFLLKQQINQS